MISKHLFSWSELLSNMKYEMHLHFWQFYFTNTDLIINLKRQKWLIKMEQRLISTFCWKLQETWNNSFHRFLLLIQNLCTDHNQLQDLDSVTDNWAVKVTILHRCPVIFLKLQEGYTFQLWYLLGAPCTGHWLDCQSLPVQPVCF